MIYSLLTISKTVFATIPISNQSTLSNLYPIIFTLIGLIVISAVFKIAHKIKITK